MQHGFSKNRSAETRTAPDPEAHRHYQELLDRIHMHFWARDWPALEPCFAIPNRVTCKDADRVFDSYADWVPALAAARDSYAKVGAKECHRLCREARFSDASRTKIAGRHVTYILRDAQFVLPPYEGVLTMDLHDGDWRASSLHAEKRDADLPIIHADRLRFFIPGGI